MSSKVKEIIRKLYDFNQIAFRVIAFAMSEEV